MYLCQEEVDEVIGIYSLTIKQIDFKIQDKLMVFTLHFHTGRRIYRQQLYPSSVWRKEVMLGEPTI
jgi:hypothetical protein